RRPSRARTCCGCRWVWRTPGTSRPTSTGRCAVAVRGPGRRAASSGRPRGVTPSARGISRGRGLVAPGDRASWRATETGAMTSPTLAGRTFAAVIFDNDGTLVDSAGAVVRSWVRWAEEHDVDPQRLTGYHGVPAATIIEEVAPHVDPVAAFTRIEELETDDVEGVVALPGVLAAVADLAGSRIAVATSATRGLAAVRLEAAGIGIDEVVTVDDVERGKPAPDPFVEAARRLEVDPTDCLV